MQSILQRSSWNKLDLLALLIEDDKGKSGMRRPSWKEAYKVRQVIAMSMLRKIFSCREAVKAKSIGECSSFLSSFLCHVVQKRPKQSTRV